MLRLILSWYYFSFLIFTFWQMVYFILRWQQNNNYYYCWFIMLNCFVWTFPTTFFPFRILLCIYIHSWEALRVYLVCVIITYSNLFIYRSMFKACTFSLSYYITYNLVKIARPINTKLCICWILNRPATICHELNIFCTEKSDLPINIHNNIIMTWKIDFQFFLIYFYALFSSMWRYTRSILWPYEIIWSRWTTI